MTSESKLLHVRATLGKCFSQVVETMTFEVFLRYTRKIEEIPEQVGLPVVSFIPIPASGINKDHTCMVCLLEQFQLYTFLNCKLLYQYMYLR